MSNHVQFVKYIRVLSNVCVDANGYIPQDSNYEEHHKTMQWKVGPQSKENFLNDNYSVNTPYWKNSFAQLNKITDQLLRKYGKKDDAILSLGSGGCGVEMKLTDDGYDITCSDLKITQFHEMIKTIFPKANFRELDILSNELGSYSYNIVTLISVSYLFSPGKLGVMFKNVHQLLKKDGLFLLSVDISPPGLVRNFILSFLLRSESHILNLLLSLKGSQDRFYPQLFGYRTTSSFIQQMAGQYGFHVKSYVEAAHEVDLTWRFNSITILLDRVPVLKRFACGVARSLGILLKMPYRRYFVFQKI